MLSLKRHSIRPTFQAELLIESFIDSFSLMLHLNLRGLLSGFSNVSSVVFQ